MEEPQLDNDLPAGQVAWLLLREEKLGEANEGPRVVRTEGCLADLLC